MAAIAIVNTNNRTGNVFAPAAASGGGDTLANTGNEILYINNASVGSITVTFVTPQTVDGQTVTNKTLTVGAGVAKVVGPFPPTIYNDQTTGLMSITYSGVTSLTIGAIQRA